MKNIADSAIVRLNSVHELSDRDFTLQKHKFLDHGGTGGAVAVLRRLSKHCGKCENATNINI